MQAPAIFKYEIPIEDGFSVMMPEGAEVLCVQVQRGVPCIWARVQPDATRLGRAFRIVGTGNPLPTDLGRYVGTFQLEPYVWHLYESS